MLPTPEIGAFFLSPRLDVLPLRPAAFIFPIPGDGKVWTKYRKEGIEPNQYFIFLE